MTQREVEVILTRQLASYLAVPIFVVDPDGNLIYYNEPAERVLGRRFEETDAMPVEEWTTIFTPTDQAGALIPGADVPLMIALTEHRPRHGSFWIGGMDSVPRHIEVSAFPLIGQADRYLGAMAIFWEAAP